MFASLHLCCCLLLGAVPPVDGIQSLSGPTMGTQWNVRYVPDSEAASPPDLQQLAEQIKERLVEINRMMSTYDPDSELSRFNRSASLEWFDVSPETAMVVQRAIDIWHDSQGAFDPTVGRLVRLWDFGPEKDFEVPTAEELAAALNSVGCEHVAARLDPPGLRKVHPEVELDLSAIAKGYAVDEIAELLATTGITRFLVEIGGEVRVQGLRPDGQPWNVGLESPREDTRQVYAVLPLTDTALATSGDYRNLYVVDGVRLSHVIDPRTGRPVADPPASVSVLAEDCMTADALATTLMVLGAEEGTSWAEERGLAICYLLRQDDGSIRSQPSAAWLSAVGPLAVVDPPRPLADAGENRRLLLTFLITLSVFLFALILLGAGTLLANRPLQGSCGGLSGMRDDHGRPLCGVCSTPPEQCDEYRRHVQTQAAKADSQNKLED